jgi:hypothetical protein
MKYQSVPGSENRLSRKVWCCRTRSVHCRSVYITVHADTLLTALTFLALHRQKWCVCVWLNRLSAGDAGRRSNCQLLLNHWLSYHFCCMIAALEASPLDAHPTQHLPCLSTVTFTSQSLCRCPPRLGSWVEALVVCVPPLWSSGQSSSL